MHGSSPTYSLRKGLSFEGHKVLNNLLFCGEILRGTVGIVGQIDVEFVIDLSKYRTFSQNFLEKIPGFE